MLTFHLFDAAQGVFESVEGCGHVALVPLPGGQLTLQFLQSLNHLLLVFGLG